MLRWFTTFLCKLFKLLFQFIISDFIEGHNTKMLGIGFVALAGNANPNLDANPAMFI